MLLVSGMVTIRVVSQSQNQQGCQGHLLLEFVEFCNEFWGISRPVGSSFIPCSILCSRLQIRI